MRSMDFIGIVKRLFKENPIPKVCITAFWILGFFYYITEGDQGLFTSVFVCVFGWFLFYGIYLLRTSKKRKLLMADQAEQILRESDALFKRMSNSTLISSYVDDRDTLMLKLKDLERLERKMRLRVNAPSALTHLQIESQAQLRSALLRFKAFIRDKMRNGDTTAIHLFDAELHKVEGRFDVETSTLAASIREELITYGRVAGSIAEIDSMEGHAFEYWCADLLRKVGFSDVEVTRGSGDQGVDILAKKDGVKYAIQCKCYSSALGNTPVQEVHAGLRMYGCQVGAVITNRYFTAGAKQLAEATGVLLWDRDWVSSMLEKSR